MDNLQTSVEANDQEWKQRCNKRMEKLKITRIPIRDVPLQKGLEQEKLHDEKHIMNFELYEAVENGNVDMFVDVVEQVFTNTELTLFAIFDQVTPSGDSLLHVAADLGREQIAELIAYHFPGLLFGTNIKRDTALHAAARFKNSNVIKIILSQVEGLTKLTNANGDTPLHVAVCSRHLGGITELLLADSHVVHYLNNSGKSPLYLAAITGDVDILDLLLQTPFPSNKPLPQCHGNSPLHAAIFERNSAILNEILKRKPELIYLRDEDGGTSLHYAAYIGYVEGVRILLNISTLTALERNRKGDLPIHLACKRGHVQVVEELLQKEWPNPRVFLNHLGQNILHVAAKSGKINVIRYLLRNKKIDWFTLNEKDNNGDTPLHLASRNLFVGVLNEIARDKRIDVNLLNNEGLSAHDVVLMHSKFPSTIREYLALAILSSAGVPRNKKTTSTLTRQKNDGIKDGISTLMLVAILIATVTFVAGFTLPSSIYNLNNSDQHKSCMTGLVNKPMFQVFTICNTISMFSSTTGSFILLWGQLGDFNLAGSAFIFALQMVGVALMTMSVAFMAALRLVASNFSWLTNIVTIIGSLFLLLIVLLYILLIFPLKFRHPLILCLASLCIEILILFDGSSDKVMAKFQQNKNSQQVDKLKDQ